MGCVAPHFFGQEWPQDFFLQQYYRVFEAIVVTKQSSAYSFNDKYIRAACATRELTESYTSESFAVLATFALGEADVSLSLSLEESQANVLMAALHAFLK